MVCWGSQSRLLDICHKYLPVYNCHSWFKIHHYMVRALSGKQMEGWGNSSGNNLALLLLDKAIKYLQADICVALFFFNKFSQVIAPIISISSSCQSVFASVGYFSVSLLPVSFPPSSFPLCYSLLPPDYGSPLKIYIKSTTPFRSHFRRPSASCRGNSWFSLYSERVGPPIHRCQGSGSFPSPPWKPKFLIT